MSTLNPTFLQRLVVFLSTQWTFGKKKVGEYDRFYGEEEAEVGRVVDLSRVEPTDVFMDLRLVRLGEDLASSEIDEKATLGGGDSPRVPTADSLNEKVHDEKVKEAAPVEKKKSKSSLRRFVTRAFCKRSRSGKVSKKSPVNNENNIEDFAQGDNMKDEGFSLKFGQMLLDLSTEEFLKIKPKNGFNVPLIVVTPPKEDGVASFTL